MLIEQLIFNKGISLKKYKSKLLYKITFQYKSLPIKIDQLL